MYLGTLYNCADFHRTVCDVRIYTAQYDLHDNIFLLLMIILGTYTIYDMRNLSRSERTRIVIIYYMGNKPAIPICYRI